MVKSHNSANKSHQSHNSANNSFISYNGCDQILQDAQQLAPSIDELIDLIGDKFINNMGETIEYNIRENLNLVIVVVGATWCTSCRRVLKDVDLFQSVANANDKQIEIIYVSLDPSKQEMMKVLNQSNDIIAVPFENKERRQKINKLFQPWQKVLPKLALVDYEGKCLQGNLLIDDLSNYKKKPMKCLVKWRKLLEGMNINVDESDYSYITSDDDSDWNADEIDYVNKKQTQKQNMNQSMNQ